MRKEFELKHVVPRSFMIGGLTAKWGIGEKRDDRYKNPLYAWTISGREDGSTDFSPLLDKMGTGNSLTLSGFDGTPGSGFENGYLVFDGVDDWAAATSFQLENNWTLIGDWEFTTEVHNFAGIYKVPRFYVYNPADGAQTRINRSTEGTVHPGVRSFRAVCSDGRLYGNEWQLYTDDKAQVVEPSTGDMRIGRVGATYTSMRFKNLAIYEGAPLSEEQCKKAYDWLQTL
nr:MAG TPA: hypothetical protein [Caudoviricetes sp.]